MVPGAYMQMESFPLTANGKLDRRALPPPDRSNLDLLSFIAPSSDLQMQLAVIWQEVLGVERVGMNDNFFLLGGDSILSLQVVARANQAGLSLTPRMLFQHPTIAELSLLTSESAPVVAQQDAVSGEVELTPIQRWLFEQEMESPDHYNQSLLLELDAGTDLDSLQKAIDKLTQHHDALRMSYRKEGALWRQENLSHSQGVKIRLIDVSGVERDKRAEALEEEATKVQQSLSLAEGRVMAVAHVDMGEQGERLLVVIHHLVVDGVSWRVLLEDLMRGYRQALRGEQIELGRKTTSFKEWAARLTEYAQSEEIREEASYWAEASRAAGARLKVDDPEGSNTEGKVKVVRVSLSEEETRQLVEQVPGAYRTSIEEVLIAGLEASLRGEVEGGGRLRVDVEGHGREEVIGGVDVTRTVGWFTTIYPVWVAAGREEGAGERMKRVKEEMRRMPRRGIGWGVMKYLSRVEEVKGVVDGVEEGEVSFNYLGQVDQVVGEKRDWRSGREGAGEEVDGRTKRRYEIEVNAVVEGGMLKADWSYGSERMEGERVEEMGRRYIEVLREMIEHCVREGGGGMTPSDFPLAEMSQQELDEFLSEISEFGD
jgi:non-ribosomal peptide synthase protein (TIGR01720 family)